MKTVPAIAPGGAVERFASCRHRVPCQGSRRRALRAIGGTPEVMQVVVDGTYDQVGTFHGNPLTMAAMKAVLLES